MNAVERMIEGARSVIAKTAALLQSNEPEALEREADELFAKAAKIKLKWRASEYRDDAWRQLEREFETVEGQGRQLRQRAEELREDQRRARVEKQRAEALVNAEPNARAAVQAFVAATAAAKKATGEQNRLTNAVEKLRAEYRGASERLEAMISKAAEARVRGHVDGGGSAKPTREPHLRDEVEELRQAVALAEQKLSQAGEVAKAAAEEVEQRRREFFQARAILAEVRFKEHEEAFFPLAADLIAANELAGLRANEKPGQWGTATITIDPPREVFDAAVERIRNELNQR